MKLTYALSIAALLIAPLAHAQSDHMKGMDHGSMSKKSQAKSHPAAGVVKSVNADKGTVTIDHGAVPTINWPAMTMTFKPGDKKLLSQLKPGAKVDFEFEQRGKDYVITKVK